MKEGPSIAVVAALIGDPARANILSRLMSGQALTAGELAQEAGVSPQTCSGHLGQLLQGGLLAVEKQGRHRYYRLAGSDVAIAIEALMDLSDRAGARRVRFGPSDPRMRAARVCYDHLAGERAVALFARMCEREIISLDRGDIDLTGKGESQVAELGVDVDALRRGRRPICRACLDWSERRSHLSGALGASLLSRFFDLGWARRVNGARTIEFSRRGASALDRLFAD